jgi:hypothetical protein
VDTTSFGTPVGGSNILFGQSDTNLTTNPSASALEQLQFGLIDNIRVDDVVPEPSCIAGLGLILTRIAVRRRRA